MTPIVRMVALSFGVAGGIITSQAPELTQQYRQRIGGALDELRIIVENFDREAGLSNLDRSQALDLYAVSTELFLRSQGISMQGTIARFEKLEAQQGILSSASAVSKPFVLVRDADPLILANTWRDFIPAIPLSVPGLIWTAMGFAAGWGLWGLTAYLMRGAYRLGAGRRYRLLH